MKKFTVDPAVFAKLPDYCLGVVVVEGFDNAAPSPALPPGTSGTTCASCPASRPAARRFRLWA